MGKHASAIEKEIKEKTIELENLRRELVLAKKRLNLKCSLCQKSSKVGQITAVQNYSEYDAGPCIGTEYRKYDLDFICPKCGIQNRLVPQKMMESLRSSFKELIDEFKFDKVKRKCINWSNKNLH